MNQDEYIKWYHIAREIINDNNLIPKRNDNEILEFVSSRDWFMFTPHWVLTKKQGESLDIPNVYLDLHRNLIEGKEARLGLTFNNVRAVDKMKNILSDYSIQEKSEIVDKLLNLEGVWKMSVKRKIKDKNFAQTHKYIEVFSAQTNEINKNIIDKIFNESEKIRRNGKEKSEKIKFDKDEFYRETPEVTLMECRFNLNKENFEKRIKEVFDVLKTCLNVKSYSDIKKIKKEKIGGRKGNNEINLYIRK